MQDPPAFVRLRGGDGAATYCAARDRRLCARKSRRALASPRGKVLENAGERAQEAYAAPDASISGQPGGHSA
jgi:hypothetical protein